MKALVDRDGARAIDRRMIDAGVSSLILMENAGRGAAELLVERFCGRLERPVIVGGAGQNGGDAWVVARRLRVMGIAPKVFLAGERAKVSGDAATQLAALDALSIDVTELGGDDGRRAFAAAAAHGSAIVEGLFGTGLDRPIEGWRAGLVEAIDAASAPCFALDLPSGIDADTGQILGVALHAEVTATFAAFKRGLAQDPGRAHAGSVAIVDIGVPAPEPVDGLLELVDAGRWLPRRAAGAHKGTAGHVLVVAGHPGTSGAAILAGHGAMRAGAGLVTLASQADLDPRVVELMAKKLGVDPVTDALALSDGKSSAVVGPGLGTDDGSRSLSRQLAARLTIPTVLDADALSAHAGDLEALQNAAAPRVLTPHPGEASRLLGAETAAIQADRYAAARELATRGGHVAVLKGAGTVVADPSGRLAVCPLGTPALGVAGTGDVLSGVIAATLASGLAPFEAACAAVLLHARAGERAAAGRDRGLVAREVADALPDALEESRL